MPKKNPRRGDVWLANFEPIEGHEQGGTRPSLVLSVNAFNFGPSELVIVVPITSKDKGVRFHFPINPPEGGLRVPSFVMTEMVRSISCNRLLRRLGMVNRQTVNEVIDSLDRLIKE